MGSPSGDPAVNPSSRQAAALAMLIFPWWSTVISPTGLLSSSARISVTAFRRTRASCCVFCSSALAMRRLRASSPANKPPPVNAAIAGASLRRDSGPHS